MSDLIAIAASGVRAFGGALDATAQNVANANTEGYVRRSAVLNEVAGSAMGGRGTQAGVRLAGLARGADEFRSSEVRRADGDVARSDAQVAGLEAVEAALAARGPGAALTGFFDAALTLSADPGSEANRAALLGRADGVADALRGVAGDLAAARDGTTQSLALGVATLDRAAADLARVNGQLLRTREGGAAEAGLLDERDRLLGTMAGLAGLSVTFGRRGIAEVGLAGLAEPRLVAGLGSAALSVSIDAKGQPAVALDGAPVTLTGGALAGRIDSLATLGEASAALDRLAVDFAGAVNEVQAGGTDADGRPGAPIFGGGDAATLIRTLSDPAGIAAARGGRDAANLTALTDLRATLGPEGGVAALVTGNATRLAARRQTGEALAAVQRGARAQALDGTAVSLDQEAANLVRYQQAFQASGRVMQAASAMLDSILAIR